MSVIPLWPERRPVALDMRAELHPRFQELPEGISALSFANVYLFRHGHDTSLSRLDGDLILVCGHDEERPWFLLPFGLPDEELLGALLDAHGELRALTCEQAARCEDLGLEVVEARDDWDYLYSRAELSTLSGRKFHKKKNLVHAFVRDWACEGRPLLDEFAPTPWPCSSAGGKGRAGTGTTSPLARPSNAWTNCSSAEGSTT